MNSKINTDEISKKYGFNVAVCNTSDIVFGEELRKACEVNYCGNYGRCYGCPPHCGTIEECIQKVKEYDGVVVLQKVYELEDSFDIEGMAFAQENFFGLFSQCIEELRKQFPDILPLGAGGCRICKTCAAVTGEECRFPEKALSSLEAHCINVSSLASACSMKYINGANTVTYFGGVFYKN